jgi:drug/metabolite transporter (DMT)-like permease
LTAILLALSASVTWGFADFGAGVASRRLPVFVVALVMQTAGLATVALVLLVQRPALPSWEQAGWAVLGGLLGVVGLSAFYRGLAVGAMGIVGPLSTTAALVPLAYGLARGERPSTLQGIGVALTIVGVLGASLEPQSEGRGRQVGAGVGLALLAAAGFGCSLLGLSKAAPGGITWAVVIMRLVAIPCFLALAFMLGPRRPTRHLWVLLVLCGIGDTLATLLFAAASTRGLLSVVAVLSSLYPVVIVVLAWSILHERVARPQLVGVALALVGVTLVSAG